MPKVYSYKRFSHIAQATGDSIRRQKDKTQEWADKNGYMIDTELQLDDRGKSAFDGTNLRTGALGQFLSLAREGKIERGSILAIEAFDRLTRAEPMDAFNLLNDLVQCGISVVTVSDGRLYDSKTLNRDLTALMMAAVMLVRGHEESRRKSEMLQGHYAKRRADGASKIGHVPPGWLRPTADGWELVPEHAATVMEIFELAAKGVGATVIARRFNAEKRAVPSRRKSKGWYPSRVSKLLRSKSVIGEYQAFIMDGTKMTPVGPPMPNHYPAAVSQELFWKVQSLLTQRAPKGRRTDGGYRNFLAGMLKCGYCGGTFTLDKKAGQDEIEKFFYSCMNANNGVTSCDNRINYKTLLLGAEARTSGRYKRPKRLSMMHALLEHLYMAGHNPARETQRQEIEDQMRAIGAQRIDCDTRKQNLLNAIEVGSITLADVASRLDKIRTEDEKLNAEQEKLKFELASLGPGEKWVVEAAEDEMETVIQCVIDISAIDQRAEFKTRLQGAIETIEVYQDRAMLKIRGSEAPALIPLTDTFSFEGEKKPVWKDEELADSLNG